MDKPNTYAEFSAQWPHQALPLTPNQRQALESLEWENHTAPAYNHQLSHGGVGTWFIGHQDSPRKDGTFEPVSVSYQLPMPEEMDYAEVAEKMKGLDRDSVERRRLWRALSPQELGYVFDQAYARRFVELARRHDGAQNPDEVLRKGGFKELDPIDVHGLHIRRFEMPDSHRGSFTVLLADSYFHLIHEKRGATRWTNLLRVRLGEQSYDKSKWLPNFWSPEVASPLAAAASMAVAMTREWEPIRRKSFIRKGPG